MNNPYVLVLYYSNNGNTKHLAHIIADGVESTGMQARIRTVPQVTTVTTDRQNDIPDTGDLYATQADLAQCSGLAMGSPTYFGNMAASLKFFLDNSVTQWLAGDLQGKPACVFSSSGSMHGGQETTLLSMMLPLMHHGMLIMGLPYSNAELSNTKTGGTPYGATQVTGADHSSAISSDEQTLAFQQGKRLALTAQKLL